MCRLADVEAPPPEHSVVVPVKKEVEMKEEKVELESFGFLSLCGLDVNCNSLSNQTTQVCPGF